jgi:hypothetical protein
MVVRRAVPGDGRPTRSTYRLRGVIPKPDSWPGRLAHCMPVLQDGILVDDRRDWFLSLFVRLRVLARVGIRSFTQRLASDVEQSFFTASCVWCVRESLTLRALTLPVPRSFWLLPEDPRLRPLACPVGDAPLDQRFGQ